MGTEEPHSLECIHTSELFPKKSIVVEDETLQVPFPTLCGEYVVYLGRTSDGVIALSNYRLLIRQKNSFVNVPMGLIDFVDTREIFFLTVYCKDATTVRCAFSTNEACQMWYKKLTDSIAPPKEMNDVFAFAFYAWSVEQDQCLTELESSIKLCQEVDQDQRYTFGKDVLRMQFDTGVKQAWRISYINEDFGVTPSYPKLHIVPASISDDDLKSVANFRALKRFPSVVWRDRRNGAVIVRCSQPELGWLGWRNTEDENLLSAIPLACAVDPGFDNKKACGETSPDTEGTSIQTTPSPKKMLLIDCRSYGAAFANRAKGGGCESADYYPCCEIQFMNLANIHSIRKSFMALRTLCSTHPDQSNWLSSLEHTKWLQYIASILRVSSLVVSTIDKEARPVLVHCSDGWDRTSQIVALAELLLDPYYRTIKGFQDLVEREWLEFGHKFADRCGNGINSDDPNERSPVFLQWLDCVFQLFRKFPCAFEFNEAFLVKLVQHTYSGLFGTFLCNCVKDRLKEGIATRTSSLWTLVLNNQKFQNLLYNPSSEQQVLFPDFGMHQLELWKSIYMSKNSLETNTESVEEDPEASEEGDVTPEQEVPGLQKTRSCENLNTAQDHPPPAGRRMSDPSISHGIQDSVLLLKELDSSHGKSTDSDTDAIENANSEVIEEVGTKSAQNEKIESGVQLTNGHCESGSDSENSDASETDKTVQAVLQNLDIDDSDENSEKTIPNGHMNGHLSEEELNGNDRMVVENGSASIVNQKLTERKQRSVESSTDTIVEGEDSQRMEQNGIGNGYVNGYVSEDEEAQDEIKDSGGLTRKHFMRKSSSISTSTSDISDSNVNIGFGECRSPTTDLKLLTQYIPMRLNCNNGMCLRHEANSTSPSPSTSSPFPTPASSRTPNSTCPPTPGTGDGKVSDSPLCRHLNSLGRHLDNDGLTTFIDPVQQRMQQMEAEYQNQIRRLELQLSATRKMLQCATGCNGTGKPLLESKEEILSLPESNEAAEYLSLGSASNAASDVSWEQVDGDDSKMTLWVPDHAVTHCAACDGAFWMVRRKHHCRSCGKVYCNDCSNYFAPVPHQQLDEPVRVCRSCHTLLLHPGPGYIVEDKRVAILVPE